MILSGLEVCVQGVSSLTSVSSVTQGFDSNVVVCVHSVESLRIYVAEV